MRRFLLLFSLTISLLFNLFFFVGYLKALKEARDVQAASGVTGAVAEELRLDEQQKSVFTELRSDMHREASAFEAGVALLEQELAEELRRDEPDLDRVQELETRRAEMHRQRRLADSRRFREFVCVLRPEQRRELVGRMQHGPPDQGGPPGRRFLDKFDRDRDGQLDEQERADARRDMREHFKMMEETARKRLLEQFDDADSDGDGVLSFEEFQTSFFGWMRDHGRRRGPRNGEGRRGRPDGPPPGESGPAFPPVEADPPPAPASAQQPS